MNATDEHTEDLTNKASLRRLARERRAALGEAARSESSLQICAHLERWLARRFQSRFQNASLVVAIYLAHRDEVSLDALAARLLENNIIVAAPRVNEAEKRMDFVRLQTLEDVQIGTFGVREPCGTEIVIPDVILVPGLAFSYSGVRLGYGGGWYDRTLSRAEFAASFRIGVAFGAQLYPRVPWRIYDAAMSYLVCENGIQKPGVKLRTLPSL